MKVQNLKPGLHIGFGGTYYTLWQVDYPDKYGIQSAWYMGNISQSKEETAEKYPDIPFTGLKGMEIERSGNFIKDDGTSETFCFGKYAGQRFEECSDLKYLVWYWGETKNTNALQVLLSSGCIFFDGNIYLTEEKADEARSYKEARELLLNGDHVVSFVSNFDQNHQISAMVDDPNFEEYFPYGFALTLSPDLSSELTSNRYKGYEYLTFKGVRTMRKGEWKIEVKDGIIIKIEK